MGNVKISLEDGLRLDDLLQNTPEQPFHIQVTRAAFSATSAAKITLRDVQNKANEVFVQFDTASLTYLTPEEDNVFKVNIPHRRNVLDFFSSSYIYADGNRESPGVRLQAVASPVKERDARATVLIGVSGAGKTRSLLDYGNTIWSIYFDCKDSVDLDVAEDESWLLLRSQIEQAKNETARDFLQLGFTEEYKRYQSRLGLPKK